MFKRFAVVMVLVLLCAFLCLAAALEGTWKCGSSVIEFCGNGPHKLKLGGNNYTFIVSGSDFLVTEGGKRVKRSFRLSDGKLQVTFGDEVQVYRKK